MCCVVTILALFGARLAAIVWYFVDTARWDAAFSNIVWPCLGVVFVPWATMAYVLMSPGGVIGLQWLVVGLGLLIDIGALGGGYRNRDRRR